jgi:hypothetical protein
MRLVLTAAVLMAIAPAAHAQFSQNASAASKQTSMAIGAIGESGLKASSGVVAIPLGGIALASGAVGIAARASGRDALADGFNAGAAEATEAAKAVVDFSDSPLTITDEIVVGRPKQPKAQPAPNVPFSPTPAQ